MKHPRIRNCAQPVTETVNSLTQEATVYCRRPIGPGDRFVLVVPGASIERQPTGVHTVREIRDGYVEWAEGGRSGIAVVLGGYWRQVGPT